MSIYELFSEEEPLGDPAPEEPRDRVVSEEVQSYIDARIAFRMCKDDETTRPGKYPYNHPYLGGPRFKRAPIGDPL